jgi:hypothetical protein
MRPDIGNVLQVVFVGDGTRAVIVGSNAMALWDLSANVEIGVPLEVPDGADAAQVSSDEDRLLAVTRERFYEWNLGGSLRLHGRALTNAVCQTVVPGSLSKLSAEELAATPVLDPRRDGDACGR